MFSRFTTALYNAVDALAPPHPLQEDFIWHWKAVTRYYTGKNASNKTPIEVTSIPGHLLEMLSILEQEEKEVEEGNIGPCMEYIMQNKLLDTMCILATSDAPPGMKRYMFMFVTKMLKIIQLSLIPHVSIYLPIQNFIELCGEIVAGPTESEEMDFLQCICDKISNNPHLVDCFLSNHKPESKRNSLTPTSSNKLCKEAESVNHKFPLITSLLKLYKSPDNDISLRARECLKSLCSCANDNAAITIAQFTSLSQILCYSVASLYRSIPKTIKTHDLENPGDEESSSKISPEKRKYLCYLQQLIFMDCLAESAHPVISDQLAQCFRTEFLDTCLYSSLVEANDEVNLIFVTTLIACSLRNITSLKLISAFSTFLLGNDDGGSNFSEHPIPTIQDILIERCRDTDKSVALSLCNLQLFEELLLRPAQSALNNLILKYLDGRSYYDITAADSWLQFSDDETCSRYSDDLTPGSSPTPKESVPTYINKIIESFLSLLPDDVKSCETEEESGYETYIKEAHGRFMKCLVFCEDFEWPQDISEKEECQFPADDDSSSESQAEADSVTWAFYEGPFLSMIFDKLESMLHQPYEINLQITSIISRLALFAHPLLHEYLLNPLIPYTRDTRSLFLVLFKIAEDIQKEVPNIRSFKSKIKLTRNALLSDGNEYATFEESNILEALIVFEEFCKELAAIAFVKYHAIS